MQGLRPTGTFSFKSLICFNGVLACLVGETFVSASSSLVPLADLLLGVFVVLLFGVFVVLLDSAFLLDLGVLNNDSGSAMGCNKPLLLDDFVFD